LLQLPLAHYTPAGIDSVAFSTCKLQLKDYGYILRSYFIKEGVVHAIDQLAAKAVPEEPKPATAAPSAEAAVLPPPPPSRRVTRSQSKVRCSPDTRGVLPDGSACKLRHARWEYTHHVPCTLLLHQNLFGQHLGRLYAMSELAPG